MNSNRILLIDAMNLMHRSYYAYPKLTTKSNHPIGAFYGFVQYLKSLQQKYNPNNIIVCSDYSRKSFRNDIYPEYKGTRSETDLELRSQFLFMEEYLDKCNITFIKKEGYEADDIIGTLSNAASILGFNPYIVSGDRDLFQLVNDNVQQIYLSTKGYIFYNTNAVIEKYGGLTPLQLIDFKGLSGDASDNIPGIKGIGEKTSIKLLNEYSNLEGIYENIDSLKGKMKEKIENGKENAFLSRKLATIDCNVPIDSNSIFKNLKTLSLCNEDSYKYLINKDIKIFTVKDIGY